MYDLSKRKDLSNSTVTDVISELTKLPLNMKVCFCGSNEGFLHVDTKENLCSLDYSDLSEDYGEEEEE